MTAAAGPSYPVTLTFDAPLQVARWRPLVHWFLAIPHILVVYALQTVAQVLAFLAWFSIVFTGKDPQGLVDLRCMCLRYQTRTHLYLTFLLEPYPPFSFGSTVADPGDLPGVRVDFVPEVEGRNRLTTFFRLLLLIPHLVALTFLGLAMVLCVVVGFFAVLITGAWPEGLRSFVVKVSRWNLRVNAYGYLLTDEYPPFTLD